MMPTCQRTGRKHRVRLRQTQKWRLRSWEQTARRCPLATWGKAGFALCRARHRARKAGKEEPQSLTPDSPKLPEGLCPSTCDMG